MANLLPRTKVGRIAFFENHVAPWAAHAAGIGLLPADVTAVDDAAAAARAAYAASQLAQQAARAATLDLDAKLRALQAAGSEAIRKIRATAVGARDGGDAVYVRAELPAPAVPAPLGPPGRPFALKGSLNPDGSLTLTWKCDNPAGSSGTLYQVRRKEAGAFVPVGTSGTRSLVDATIPAGTPSVVYEICAVRSTAAGTAAQFGVNFGVGGAAAPVAAAVRVAA